VTDEPLRAAVIGCGRIGCQHTDSHAAAYAASRHTRLVAVADESAERAAECVDRFPGAQAYVDVRNLLEAEEAQVVSVCTPNETHVELLQTVMASRHVLGVLAEKPLALTERGARRVVAMASERDVVLAVNYIRRYAPGIERLRGILRSGELGHPNAISGYYTKGLLHNGSHWLDLVRYLLGEVEVIGASRADPHDDSQVSVWVSTPAGAGGALIGLDADDFTIFELDIVASQGRARLTDGGESIEIWHRQMDAHLGMTALALDHRFAGGLSEAVSNAVDDLVACIRTGRTPKCQGQDGVVAVALAERALALARPKLSM
jgi:predicted dehydrogenase